MAAPSGRATRRLRSESCGDDEGAKAGRAEVAPGGETPPGRSHVSRSQSLDLGTAAAAAAGDGTGDRQDLSLDREEHLSRRKVRRD